MPRARLVAALSLLACAAATHAHHAPNSFVRLDFRAQSVRAQVMVPRSELGYALQGTPTADALPGYLLRHLGAATAQGAAWSVKVLNVRAVTYVDQPYFSAEVEFAPPPGGSTRDFVLTNDAVTHEVRNHVVYVVAEKDYADASLAAAPKLLGILQYPQRQLAVRAPRG